MVYDPTWSQPLVNWQQQGSFVGPATPPGAGPLDGTLVQLPCINIDWLPLVLGALDQLRNPSSWLPSLTDAQLYDVLGDADTLRSAIGQALTAADPCVNALVDLTFASCTFTKHFADGSTAAVVDWADAVCSCVQGCIPVTPPTNPIGSPTEQHACNISGYLATEIIQRATQIAITYAQNEIQLTNYINQVMGEIAYLFPITAAAVDAFTAYFQQYILGTLSHFEFAATDADLWSAATCAIFNAIRADGYITASNLPTLISNVCAIGYIYPDVITAICHFVSNIGLTNLEQAQNVGAVDDVDCSSCGGSWCKYFDFTTDANGWVPYPGDITGPLTAAGFQSAQDPSLPGNQYVSIMVDMPQPATITEIQVRYTQLHANHTGAVDSVAIRSDPTHIVAVTSFTPGTVYPGSAWSSQSIAGFGIRLSVYMASDSIGDPQTLVISGVQVRGTGVCPFDRPNDCIVGP